MEETITTILIALGTAIGSAFATYKKINSERKKTAEQREQQIKELDLKNHDDMLKLKFEVQYLKDEHVLTKTVIDDLRDSINVLNQTIASLKATLDMLRDQQK